MYLMPLLFPLLFWYTVVIFVIIIHWYLFIQYSIILCYWPMEVVVDAILLMELLLW